MSEGQVVLTGASGGIGAGIAVELDERGYPVVGLSRSGTAPAGRALCCDVTDEAAFKRSLAEIAAEGPIRALINNAGINEGHRSAELSTADYERIMRVNATSVLIGCREVQPHLLANGGGTIINMGSFFDKVGVQNQLAYSASKAAIGAMTRVLAVEWARYGIAVLNVAPGYVETELSDIWQNPKFAGWIESRVPLKRPATTNEIARLVGAILDENIPFLTGETIYIDGAHGINH